MKKFFILLNDKEYEAVRQYLISVGYEKPKMKDVQNDIQSVVDDYVRGPAVGHFLENGS